MRTIKLDAYRWRTTDDFYDAILSALEAPHWHGRNVNALTDSMWGGSINGVEPPYKVWIVRTRGLPEAVKQQVNLMVEDIGGRQGKEPEIIFQIDP